MGNKCEKNQFKQVSLKHQIGGIKGAEEDLLNLGLDEADKPETQKEAEVKLKAVQKLEKVRKDKEKELEELEEEMNADGCKVA
jgi:hypothetical protein